ncbi:MAG: hypothetical protein QOE35_3603 [Actinomycetota bacterium]|jgi:hypothetical protein
MLSLRPRRPESRTAGIALVLMALSAGCVHAGDPSVGVKTVAADIIFGVAPKTVSPVPNTGPLTEPAQPFNDGDLLPADAPDRNLAKPKAPTRAGAAPLCREATVNDVPGEQSPDTVTTQRPTVGTYLWKRAGSQKIATAPGKTFDSPIGGYEDRLVKNVTETAAPPGTKDSYFEYETVQKDLGGNIATTHWRVRPNALNRAVFAPNVGDVNTNVGQPDRGLSMTGVDVRTTKGDTVPAFSPRSPLLFLPLPITAGNKWSSQSVDSRSLATLQIDGGVVGHTNVDACGTLLDGWLVQSTLTYSDGSTTETSVYNYVVALQYGALIIGEHTEAPKDNPTLVTDFNIGQVSPRPLPS